MEFHNSGGGCPLLGHCTSEAPTSADLNTPINPSLPLASPSPACLCAASPGRWHFLPPTSSSRLVY